MKKAVIYTRVSSMRQLSEGHGLESQELTCRNYANLKGYEVVKVFSDGGVSGKYLKRPAMDSLLEFLDSQDEEIVVIFDDIKRFSREVENHFRLKNDILIRGGIIESPTISFSATPEGKFFETMLAAGAEYERNQNREQVIRRMKSRMQNGYWSFFPPVGLKFIKLPAHGKIMAPDEVYGPIIKEMIEKYRDGYLNTLEDCKQFLKLKYTEASLDKSSSLRGVDGILKSPLYAGYIEYLPWDIKFQKAKHEGLIDLNTFYLVQEKLRGKAKPPVRKDAKKDFPLRGSIRCAKCKKYVTGGWNKGRTKYYANYHCKQRDCEYYGKSMPQRKVHPAFENLISKIELHKSVVKLAALVLEDLWNEKQSLETIEIKNSNSELDNIENKIKTYLERIAQTTNQLLIEEYEQEIEKLLEAKKEFKKNSVPLKYTSAQFGTALNNFKKYLGSPMELWNSDDLEEKKRLANFYFAQDLEYDLYNGFGTVEYSLPVKLIIESNGDKKQMVEVRRIELLSKKLLTNRYVQACSI